MLPFFLEKFFDSLKDAKLAPHYLAQLDQLRDQMVFLEQRHEESERELERANAKINEQIIEIQKLREQLSALDGKAKLIEIGPCFIKETPDGKRLPGVYCPDCRMPLDLDNYYCGTQAAYCCPKCKIMFKPKDIDSAVKEYGKISSNNE